MDHKPSQKVYSNFCEVPVVFPIVILDEVPVVFPIVFPDEVPVVFPDEVHVGNTWRNFFKSAAGGRLALEAIPACWRRSEPGGDAEWPPATQGNASGAIHGPGHNKRLPLHSSVDKLMDDRSTGPPFNRMDRSTFWDGLQSILGRCD